MADMSRISVSAVVFYLFSQRLDNGIYAISTFQNYLQILQNSKKATFLNNSTYILNGPLLHYLLLLVTILNSFMENVQQIF